MGLDAVVAVGDSDGGDRPDLAVRVGGRVCLFEFRMKERSAPGAALAQIKGRGYADKYRYLGEPIHLVGVEFSSKTRNVARFEAEPA